MVPARNLTVALTVNKSLVPKANTGGRVEASFVVF